MEAPILILLAVAAVVVFDLAAVTFGTDSRELGERGSRGLWT
ncbi:MAG TPA: hypothetical protein VH720_12745 [Candidatus Limnocylindrales bacterium]|jgi:hypothetical protein